MVKVQRIHHYIDNYRLAEMPSEKACL